MLPPARSHFSAKRLAQHHLETRASVAADSDTHRNSVAVAPRPPQPPGKNAANRRAREHQLAFPQATRNLGDLAHLERRLKQRALGPSVRQGERCSDARFGCGLGRDRRSDAREAAIPTPTAARPAAAKLGQQVEQALVRQLAGHGHGVIVAQHGGRARGEVGR